MANYDSIDCAWSWDGDYAVGIDGDLADTSADLLQSLVTEIQTIVKSETFDWEKDPGFAVNLADFQGQPNVRQIGQLIESRIKSTLTEFGLVSAGDLQVKTVPTHQNEILIALSVKVAPTLENGLSVNDPIQVHFVYNTQERSIFFLLDNKAK